MKRYEKSTFLIIFYWQIKKYFIQNIDHIAGCTLVASFRQFVNSTKIKLSAFLLTRRNLSAAQPMRVPFIRTNSSRIEPSLLNTVGRVAAPSVMVGFYSELVLLCMQLQCRIAKLLFRGLWRLF